MFAISCEKEKTADTYYERHEQLIWNSSTNQFNFVFMHETAPERVEEPHLDWQYYGGYYSGTSTMKYRYNHIEK